MNIMAASFAVRQAPVFLPKTARDQRGLPEASFPRRGYAFLTVAPALPSPKWGADREAADCDVEYLFPRRHIVTCIVTFA